MGVLVEEIQYAYDANGNKILRRIKTENQPVDTVWHYDSLNQLKETIEAAGTPEQRRVERHYDISGKLITLVKNDGTSLRYVYDALGRRTSLISSDGSLHYTFRYDENDNLLSAKDKITGKSVRREYDKYDQLIKDTLPYGHTLTYDYDTLGHTKQITLPDQSSFSYLYEGDRLIEIKRNGNLTYSHLYTAYDKSSNPTKIHLAGDAGKLKIHYDLLNRPTKIQTSHWRESLKYEAHLLKQRQLHDPFGETDSNYKYDARSQLLSEDGTSEHRFEYDWQGNSSSYDGKSRRFDACNTLLNHNDHHYKYDANGNRISDGVNLYRYDALDRLIEATTPAGTYRYIYDALGRRVVRLHDEETTYFLWQKEKEIGTISPNGIIDELQILNPSNQSIAIELKSTLYVPIHDIFGHVRALLNSSGECVATYRYSAFGEEQISGTILSPWRYAGKRIDSETGFIYFGERYYDPASLTWITQDPMEDADGPNLYTYVHNNPLLYVDPDGCLSWDFTNSKLFQAAMILFDAALIYTVAGSCLTAFTEGFLAGCSGGLLGTATDLAINGVGLYAEGGIAAACATAEASTIACTISKTIGQVAGAAFNCALAGKVAHMGMKAASTALIKAREINKGIMVKHDDAKSASEGRSVAYAKGRHS